MFNDLKQQLSNITARLSGKGFLSEEHINKACSEISDVLLESDVGIDMVDSLVNKVKQKAAQTKIYESLSPQQTFVKLVKDELLLFIDNDQIDINLKGQPPVPIMLVGLQGSGKTTSTAKLAKLIAKSKKISDWSPVIPTGLRRDSNCKHLLREALKLLFMIMRKKLQR